MEEPFCHGYSPEDRDTNESRREHFTSLGFAINST